MRRPATDVRRSKMGRTGGDPDVRSSAAMWRSARRPAATAGRS